jgi:hypothetical protein
MSHRSSKKARLRNQESPRVQLPGLEFDFTIEEILALIHESGERCLSDAERYKITAVAIAMAKACEELELEE